MRLNACPFASFRRLAFSFHRRSGCRRADCKDRIFDIDGSGFLEFECSFDRLTLFERMFKLAEHDVKTRWRKSNGFTRFNFKPTLDRVHFHNATLHGHAVNFALRARIV
jgi:hypothetical protein